MFRNFVVRQRWLLVTLLLGIIGFPIYTTCGAPGYSCTSAPDQRGVITRYYEIEPLGISVIEAALHTNLGLYYSSGHEEEKLKNWQTGTESQVPVTQT